MADIPTPESRRSVMGGILVLAVLVFGYFWYATAPMDAIAPIPAETLTQ